MNWKDRALQAANAKAAQDEETKRQRDAEERKRQIAAFQEALRALLDSEVSVEDLEATVDEVTFAWKRESFGKTWGIVMKGKCPTCGDVTWSMALRSLTDVGQNLQHFTPDPWGHNTMICGNKVMRRSRGRISA